MPFTESKREKKDRQKFEAESDLRTLRTAQEINGDKGRMERAMAMAKEELAAIEKVTDG